MCENENKEEKKLDLESLEGLRGDGEAKWYVVHTYSGHENKVKVNIEKIVENRGMQDLILDVIVPTEDRVEAVSYTHLDVYKRQVADDGL